MYTVTRQSQWPDGVNIVEVSLGGIDYTNPDTLGAKYSGEFEEYSNPIDAVTVAISIAREWRKDSGQRVAIGIGATLGMTMPFDPISQKDALAWAKKEWDSLEKCPHCGNALPDKRQRWYTNDWDGLEYCSEECATRMAEFEAEQDAEFNAEQEEEAR